MATMMFNKNNCPNSTLEAKDTSGSGPRGRPKFSRACTASHSLGRGDEDTAVPMALWGRPPLWALAWRIALITGETILYANIL